MHFQITHGRDERDAEFQVWIERYPTLVGAFIAISHELRQESLDDGGTGHVVTGLAWELLRHRTRLLPGGAPRLNNNYQSRMVRRAIEVDPSLATSFDIRSLSEGATTIEEIE